MFIQNKNYRVACKCIRALDLLTHKWSYIHLPLNIRVAGLHVNVFAPPDLLPYEWGDIHLPLSIRVPGLHINVFAPLISKHINEVTKSQEYRSEKVES
jgi:hypothetical protein